jgi:hypothetical protein
VCMCRPQSDRKPVNVKRHRLPSLLCCICHTQADVDVTPNPEEVAAVRHVDLQVCVRGDGVGGGRHAVVSLSSCMPCTVHGHKRV